MNHTPLPRRTAPRRCSQWRRFDEAIQRAMTTCEQTGNAVSDHFADAGKMVTVGSGAERNVKDYHLSRLACYLIAQNGDPRKAEIAAAQVYFAISTRAHEMHQLHEEQEKRLAMCMKVSESYKQLAEVAYANPPIVLRGMTSSSAKAPAPFSKASNSLRVLTSVDESPVSAPSSEFLVIALFSLIQCSPQILCQVVCSGSSYHL